PCMWERPVGTLLPGMTEGKWERIWQPLLHVDRPWTAYNPAQCFGRGYAERLFQHPRLDELVDRMERSTIHACEELVWPSLAVGWSAADWAPYSDGISLRRYTPAEIKSFLDSPDIHLVHKVSPDPEAADRQIVEQLVRG